MSAYAKDRAWSDLMIPQIKRIVGPYLLEIADFEHDAKQATDLMVLTGRDMRIAARVRRPGYASKYPSDFTLRSQRSTGAETELFKIQAGWGDWLFYGHTDGENVIRHWHLICLDTFRNVWKGPDSIFVSARRLDNKDGTFFFAFDLRSFPSSPPILVASSDPSLPRLEA